jgi:hypothetical protein
MSHGRSMPSFAPSTTNAIVQPSFSWPALGYGRTRCGCSRLETSTFGTVLSISSRRAETGLLIPSDPSPMLSGSWRRTSPSTDESGGVPPLSMLGTAHRLGAGRLSRGQGPPPVTEGHARVVREAVGGGGRRALPDARATPYGRDGVPSRLQGPQAHADVHAAQVDHDNRDTYMHLDRQDLEDAMNLAYIRWQQLAEEEAD